MSEPASIQYNNPGAINGNAAWVRDMPGYIRNVVIGGGNPIAVFDTPEHGVACYYTLLQRYARTGAKTVRAIINRYGGGQDYSAYEQFVVRQSGLSPSTEIMLTDDDERLLKFAKAMFRYEAGKPSPLSDATILLGFDLVRGAHKNPAGNKTVVVGTGAGTAAAIAAQSFGAHWSIAIGIGVAVLVIAVVIIRGKK